jgi:hypothetical protein
MSTLIETSIDRAKLRNASSKKESAQVTPEKQLQFGKPHRIIRPLPLKLKQQLE